MKIIYFIFEKKCKLFKAKQTTKCNDSLNENEKKKKLGKIKLLVTKNFTNIEMKNLPKNLTLKDF